MHAELTLGLGLPVNLKRVARLMREAGLQGLYRRRRHGCTVRDPDAQPSADLVNRQFSVDAPNRLWITDITEHPTAAGKVYCAAVMDAYSRLIVGWSIAEHMRTELVTDALGMAIVRRRPQNRAGDQPTILHSDHGAQFTSWAFGQLCVPQLDREVHRHVALENVGRHHQAGNVVVRCKQTERVALAQVRGDRRVGLCLREDICTRGQ